MIVNWKWYSTDHDDHIEVHGHQVAFQLFFWLQSSSACAKSFLPVSSLKTNDCATQRAFSTWIFNFPKYFAKARNPIWNLARAMWNVLCKQCNGPEDPVCHEDLTFRPPDGSFESCESSTGEHSTIRRKPQTGAKSLYERISLLKSLLACIGLNQPITIKKCFFFLQNLSPCSILFWQFRRLWTHSFSFNALKNAGG